VALCVESLAHGLHSLTSVYERKPQQTGRSAHHERDANTKGQAVMGTILLIILILLLLGAVPVWPHSRGWGYYPGGGIGLILIIVLILVLMGRI